MNTINYHNRETIDLHFVGINGGQKLANLVFEAIHLYESKCIEPAIGLRDFNRIVEAIGPVFLYESKQDVLIRDSDKPEKMVFCRLPLLPFNPDQLIANAYRLYIVKYDTLLFYRSLLVDVPILPKNF